MPLQLSLFGDENVLYNTAIQRLLALDFPGCVEELRRYRAFFPGGRDVDRAVEVATFLEARLGPVSWTRIDPEEAERRYQVWLEFEEAFGWPWRPDSLENRLQPHYFSSLVDGLAKCGDSKLTALPGGAPLGACSPFWLVGQRRPWHPSEPSLRRIRRMPGRTGTWATLTF